MCTTAITKAPALDIDAYFAQRGEKLGTESRIERAIVWNLCAHLAALGWLPVSLHDGDESHKVETAHQVMELVFNLDESNVYFRKGGTTRWVFLVNGNGVDMISDYTYDPVAGFTHAMESFDAELVVASLLGGVN